MSDERADVVAATVSSQYLKHLLASAEKREISTSEDVVTISGVKLLPRGTLIDASLSDKLLAARLVKPFEECVQVSDGVTPAQRREVCEQMLAKHALLQRLDIEAPEKTLPEIVGGLHLPLGLQSLLTIYADQRDDRLQHACTVSLVTLALARRLLGEKGALCRQLAMAGLLHDVGELYLPSNFKKVGELPADQWKQIALHPFYGSKLLGRMEGAGPVVAEAVLCHHERLDGFGYPRGIADEQFKLPNQLVAIAEWLTGLMEAGIEPLMRASVASRLIPGEFSPQVLEPVHQAMRGTIELSQWLAAQQDEIVKRVRPLVEALERFHQVQAWADQRAAGAGGELRTVLQRVTMRLTRLQTSFSNAGIDVANVDFVLAELQQGGNERVQQELGALLGEFSWRMREMERACLLRASLMGPDEMAIVKELLERVRGAGPTSS